jgi:hypothetical protein
VRPGRVDMTVRLGEVTRYQVGSLWAVKCIEQSRESHIGPAVTICVALLAAVRERGIHILSSGYRQEFFYSGTGGRVGLRHRHSEPERAWLDR